ncbi:hypothetical protein D1AOALGA4SA_2786 [Olavius algarvensis Delta 1 endosymbiont]|nr:hypothetical protein D1AOALGA4SA_2786 [Olavius algarvensis Delta 1 endosymbiont]
MKFEDLFAYQDIPTEAKYRIDDVVCIDFRFWIGDFGFKEICLFY